MANKNFRISIEYDGTDFHGWQRQRSDRTVQAEIEAALSVMTRQKIAVHGSGRTDAGVHALGQVASFRCETRLTAADFFSGLNGLLPDDIAVLDCREADDGFHARYSAKSKRYRYCILNRPLPAPLDRRFCWHVRSPLDVDAMAQASAGLVGTHDFSSFEASGSPRSHSRRTVTAAGWEIPAPDRLHFTIEADGFLRCMVRNIVGTLVEIGSGKRRAAQIETLLASADRSLAGPTAPARGLFLIEVRYDSAPQPANRPHGPVAD
ncbi:MAG: tRNA pseudouridine(38-40) synthase TruA [Desulfobacterales bacterium]|jgi:tRNA pseudouridine38-40 synthase